MTKGKGLRQARTCFKGGRRFHAPPAAAADKTQRSACALRVNNSITARRGRIPHARSTRQTRRKGQNMLANIISLVSGCVTFLGGFLVVWGAVSLGLAIREQQGGSQIASAISTIAGGAIIIAAAVYFGMLDTSWLPS